jgi:hypothetical protein
MDNYVEIVYVILVKIIITVPKTVVDLYNVEIAYVSTGKINITAQKTAPIHFVEMDIVIMVKK